MESQIKGIISEAVLANDPEIIMTCFELLSKLFKNIIDNPKEPKFRQFNSENQHLKGKVLNIPQISLLIEIIGYCESETKGILVISDDLLGNIEICYKEIQSFIKLNEKSKIDKIESFTNVDKYQNNDINKGKYKVTLYVYDLTRGMAKQLSPMLLGKRIEGVWHTGIVIHDTEIFYGGGICTSKPKGTPFGFPNKEIVLGYTDTSKELVDEFLADLKTEYTAEKYNLINHNCNHFTNSLSECLLGKGIPSDILEQHKVLINSPFGKQLMPLLESINTSPENMRR